MCSLKARVDDSLLLLKATAPGAIQVLSIVAGSVGVWVRESGESGAEGERERGREGERERGREGEIERSMVFIGRLLCLSTDAPLRERERGQGEEWIGSLLGTILS
jgi:hypothetical protein